MFQVHSDRCILVIGMMNDSKSTFIIQKKAVPALFKIRKTTGTSLFSKFNHIDNIPVLSFSLKRRSRLFLFADKKV